MSHTEHIHNKYSMNENKPKQNELEQKSVGRKITKPNTDNLIACGLGLSS